MGSQGFCTVLYLVYTTVNRLSGQNLKWININTLLQKLWNTVSFIVTFAIIGRLIVYTQEKMIKVTSSSDLCFNDLPIEFIDSLEMLHRQILSDSRLKFNVRGIHITVYCPDSNYKQLIENEVVCLIGYIVDSVAS